MLYVIRTTPLRTISYLLVTVDLFFAGTGSGRDAATAPASAETACAFKEQLIAGDYAYAYGLGVADLDGDGDLDVTSADYTPHNCLYWYENDGRGQFTRHHIQKDDPERLERHQIADIDQDGHLDVVIVKNLRGDLLWFRNSGTPRDSQLWTRYVITTDLPGAYDVAVADFDRDGDLDVAASSWRLGNQFAWFENDSTPRVGAWKKHLIASDVLETRTMRAADFNGDGHVDLLGTVSDGHRTMWYENRGDPARRGWTPHVIDDTLPRPVHGAPVDIDRDGDLDVVMALGMPYEPGQASAEDRRVDRRESQQVVWYENNGRPAAGAWPRHPIVTGFDDAFEATAGDLDGDGDVDVVATSWRNPGRIAWFENRGDPRADWTMHLLKENWRSANMPVIADLNGDGRPDIVASAERGSNEVRWWRNDGRPVASP